MTPQERQLITDLFDRLAAVEGQPRDAEAMAAIAGELRRAPHAVYALVQTVLVQDEALARANDRIEELERGAAAAPAPGGFLESMRDTLFGGGQPRRGSVPPSGEAPAWGSGPTPGGAQPETRGAGGASSFLGTAAAAAAGVVGGSLLMNSIRDLMGGGKGQAVASESGGERASPWGGGDQGRSDLARDAGLDDIGNSGRGGDARSARRDEPADDSQLAGYDDEDEDEDEGDYGEDDDNDDFGDTDFA